MAFGDYDFSQDMNPGWTGSPYGSAMTTGIGSSNQQQGQGGIMGFLQSMMGDQKQQQQNQPAQDPGFTKALEGARKSGLISFIYNGQVFNTGI